MSQYRRNGGGNYGNSRFNNQGPNSSYNQNYGVKHVPGPPKQQPPVQPPIQKPPPVPSLMEVAPEPQVDPVSAVTKASQNLEKRYKRRPKSVRKKIMNARLSHLMAPKPALMVLNELIPSVKYQVVQQRNTFTTSFFAEAVDNDVVLGTGKGKSRNGARTCAAVDALKKMVNEIMTSDIPPKEESSEADGEDAPISRFEKIPWSGLASYALHRLLSDWKQEGVSLTPTVVSSDTSTTPRPSLPLPPQPRKTTPGQPRTELPEGYLTMHPKNLLNIMRPGIIIKTLARTILPSTVTAGVEINGKLFTGIASNQKAASKIAAENALREIYGVVYPNTV